MILRTEQLRFAYGPVVACRDLNIDVGQGEIVTLIGANGAGKSTTLRGIAGAMSPAQGRIFFEGRDVTALPAHERTNLGIALVPEGRHVFPYLTVTENLEVGGYKFRRDKARTRRDIERMFDMFPRLRERATQKAGTLSGGEQQMLVLSRALMSEPKLLCLDEPSLGLAPIVVKEIFKSIVAVNATGMSILLVEQNARYALETASRGYVLKNGEVIASGSCEALKNDDRVQSAYLGQQKAVVKLAEAVHAPAEPGKVLP